MRRLLKLLTATLAAVTLQFLLVASASAAPSPAAPVQLSASQVANALFVAGDVGRLSQVPSGTEDVVLENVLQQLYLANPALDPAQAEQDIQSLQSTLSSGSGALSAATLTVMAGNQRILAILRVLADSAPAPDVAHAVAQVTDEALNEASQSAQMLGQAFDASADSLSTISYMTFSPARTLAATAALAATDHQFGQARDGLWKAASHESVFDDAQTLLSENPALQNGAVSAFASLRAADGSLSTTAGQLESAVSTGIVQIDDQNCTLTPGTTGASPSDCASGALHDAQLVAQQCPNGSGSTGAGCTSARNQAQSDASAELAAIAAQQAASAAAGAALAQADQALGQAEIAEGQAAAQVADEENQYLNYQSTQSYEKAGFDVATLAVTLSVSEVDPVAAISGLFNVIGDAVGFGFGGPDPNMIILQGLQNVSQQISDFETYTQSAFHALDTQLSNLTTQIATDAYQLSAQLTQAQQQITQLATQLTTLQGSVDHLQSEVQSLFAQGARNDLGTLVNQYLGYEHANGVPLPQSQFAQAAGALYQDATSTALTQTILNVPTGFDALTASGLVMPSDPLSLDSNINLFNYFPSQVSDSAVSWPGDLTDSCPAGADLAHDLCLPDPDFWATSARAFAQLLSENPQYVTPTRLQQLSTIMQEGQVIANALHQLSVNDAGSDQNGTGNRTLDSAINYYTDWGTGTHPSSSPPSLVQALRDEEQRYLGSQNVPGQPLTYAGVSPWGGVSQAPDLATLQHAGSFSAVPPCSQFASLAGITPASYQLPYLPSGIFSFLPSQVLNAVRLGIGHVSACWGGNFYNVRSGGSGPDGLIGNLVLSMTFDYVSSDGSIDTQVGQTQVTVSNIDDCTSDGNSNGYLEAADNIIGNWPGTVSPNTSCFNIAPALAAQTNVTSAYPSNVQQAIEPLITSVLSSLQQGVYGDVLSGGSTLTTGTSQATDVQAAAQRLEGANAIVDGYISLGLPQALASDDTLRSLVSGASEDAFASSDPARNPWGAQPARDLPDQIVNLYKAAEAAPASSDPTGLIESLVFFRASDLQTALRPHIVVSGSSDPLAEVSPLIGPTLDRLDETSFGLGDALANGATVRVSIAGSGTVSDGSVLSCSSACAHNYAAGTLVNLTATPAAGSSFAGWTGACTGTGSCVVPLDYDQAVGATFVPAPSSPPPTATTTTTTPAPAPAATASHASPVRCTVSVPSNRILLARPKKARRGTPPAGALIVRVRCTQAARISVTGQLVRLIGPKPKHGRQRSQTFRLGPVRGAVRPGASVSLIVRLPAAALRALAARAKESVTLTLTASNANGRSGATVRVRTLVPMR